ncbi:hypothetical protein D3C71_1238100 [compost metagenome]
MRHVAQMPETGRQVRGADKEAVRSRHRGNRLDIAYRGRRFDLQNCARLRICGPDIAGILSVSPGAHQARHATRAAIAIARKVHRSDCVARVFGGIDVGKNNRLRTTVHGPLDQRGIVGGNAHRGDRHGAMRASRIDGPQLSDQAAHIIGRVLHVHHQPVETTVRNGFGDSRATQRQPASPRRRAGQQCFANRIRCFQDCSITIRRRPFHVLTASDSAPQRYMG